MGHFDKISEILDLRYGPKHRKLNSFVNFVGHFGKYGANGPMAHSIVYIPGFLVDSTQYRRYLDLPSLSGSGN